MMKELFEMVAIGLSFLLTELPVCTKIDLITPPNDAVAFAFLIWNF